MEPKISKREMQLYAGIRTISEREELPEVVPRSLAIVVTFLQKHRIRPTGAPLVRYFAVDYNTGEVEIDAGIPVDAVALPADPHVRSAEIPSGSFATVIHCGPYGTLVQTTAALLDWALRTKVHFSMVERRKVTRWDGRIEHYLVGPPDEPDPRSWRTEIAILVAEG